MYLNESAEKRRFEIAGGRIRARYGHSLPGTIAREATTPPSVLYHGTSRNRAERILQEGLRSMGRQHVHLSTDRATARRVGARRAGETVILRIDASGAAAAGVRFFGGNADTWLSDDIPAQFVQIDSGSKHTLAKEGGT
jgi:putative RNA 2'-phosphotransferase